MFDLCCRVHSLDGLAMLSHLWSLATPVNVPGESKPGLVMK